LSFGRLQQDFPRDFFVVPPLFAEASTASDFTKNAAAAAISRNGGNLGGLK